MRLQPRLQDQGASFAPAITPAADLELVKRQAQTFLGWTYEFGSWDSWTCYAGRTITEAKGYVGCSATTLLSPEAPPTACVANTLFFSSTTITCNPGNSCVTGTLAATAGAEANGELFIECANSPAFVIYKTTPVNGGPPNAATATPTTAAPTTIADIPAATSTRAAATPATLTVIQSAGTTILGGLSSISSTAGSSESRITSSTTSSSTSTNTAAGIISKSSSNGSLSGAGIAGAVVGPICGVALILGLAFLFLRRRHNNATTAATVTGADAVTGAGAGAVAGAGNHSQPPVQEMTQYPPQNYADAKHIDQYNGQTPNQYSAQPNQYNGQVPNQYGNGQMPNQFGNGQVPMQYNGQAPNQYGQTPAQHNGMNAPPPELAGQQVGYPNQMQQAGPVASELETNAPVHGMPPELPAAGWTRA